MGIQRPASWLRGVGWVALYTLVEDAATVALCLVPHAGRARISPDRACSARGGTGRGRAFIPPTPWVARVLGHTPTEMVIRHYHKFIPNLTRRDGSAVAELIARSGL
ncbi:MAG: hypothetical protein HY215_03945 [Candidatus Rokubacteria bacterium]|nr:hypothetical protein [Candidatus Rokubacteria bacterium]